MYKVISTSPTFGKYAKEPLTFLQENDCEIIFLPNQTIKDKTLLAEALKDADAYIVGFEKVTSSLLRDNKSLKVIAKHGVGIDNIEIEALKEKNIKLVYAPGGNKHAVAEFVFALLLNASRHIGKAYEQIKDGGWPKLIGKDLRGKNLGVIGTGNIGKEVIKIAKGFQMNIFAFDLYPDHNFEKELHFSYCDLNFLLRKSDYITIHTDLNEDSRALIGSYELNLMKKTAYLINTSRGGIVDEKALYNALHNHEISGAALDVYEQEPVTNSPLLALSNFTATPHIAGYSYGALHETGMITARNILNVLQDKKPEYEYQI